MDFERVEGDSMLRVTFRQPAREIVVIMVAGEVDASSAPRLGALVHPWLAAPTRIAVMDLSAVTFLDSAGVELLCDCQHRGETWSVSFRVATRCACVQRLIELLDVGDRFDCYPSVSAALAN